MNPIEFTPEQYMEMWRCGIITEEDMCNGLAPKKEDLPPSKVVKGVKWTNKLAVGFGVATLTSATAEKVLPPVLVL